MIVPTQGNAISERVQKAINLRVRALKERAAGTSENLQAINYYFNSRTPWIRMTSSVDTEEEGSQLAKDNVLGMIKNDNDRRTPSGTEISNDFGIRPPAGITGMQVTSLGRFGALRDITVTFKCFSQEQLDKYEKLFMRPGASVLVEWGHSLYLSEDGDAIRVNEMGPGYQRMFDNTKKTIRGVYADIKKLRDRYNYEYDGAFGIIKNFSWSFEGAGPSYECRVVIGSQGEVIGSIDSNLPLPNKLAEKYRDQGSYSPGRGLFLATDNQPIQDFEGLGDTATGYDKNILSDIASQYVPFFDSKQDWELSSMLKTFLYQDLFRVYHSNVVSRVRREAFGGRDFISDDTIELTTFAFLTPINSQEGTLLRTLEGVNSPHLIQALGYRANLLTILFEEEKEEPVDNLTPEQAEFYADNEEIAAYTAYRAMSYLRYGDLLQFLNNMMINDGLDNLVEFETSTAQLTYQNLYVNSIDPRVCLLPVDVATLLKGTTSSINFRDPQSTDYNAVVDIALNVESLYEIAENTRGSIKDFLDGVNNAISTATGGFIDLDVVYSEEEAIYTIVDRRHFEYPSLPELSLLGTDSILRDFKLDTALSNDVASAMAISLGDASSRDEISKTVLNFYKGIKDRNLPKKEAYPPVIVKDPEGVKVSGEAENGIALADIVMRSIYEYRLFSDSLTDNVLQIFPKYIVENAPQEQLGGVILPYTLSMNMDGLSGILIMDSFLIKTNLLPSSYVKKDKVANLVTGIDVTVNQRGWTVNLKSQYYNIRGKSADVRFKKFSPRTQTTTKKTTEVFKSSDTYNNIQYKGVEIYNSGTDNIDALEVWTKANFNNTIQPQVLGMLTDLTKNIKTIDPITLQELDDTGFGLSIEIYSTFRTINKQRELYLDYIQRKAKGRGGLPAAQPGRSMHNWGGAFDFKLRDVQTGKELYNSRTKQSSWRLLGIQEIVSKYGFRYGVDYDDPVHIGYNVSGQKVYDDFLTGKVKDWIGNPITDSTGTVINTAVHPVPELAVDLRVYNSNPGIEAPQFIPNVREIIQQTTAQSDITDVDLNIRPPEFL